MSDVDIWDSLGTQDIGKGKITVFTFILILILLVLWFSQNLADEQKKVESFWYFGLGLFFLGFVGLQYTIGKYTPIFSTITYEKETMFGELPKNVKFILAGFCVLLFFVFVFYIQSAGKALISAPMMQAVHLDTAGNILYMIALTTCEIIVFTGIMPAFCYGLGMHYTKNHTIAILMAILLSPTIFMLYHVGTYGYSDMSGSLTVFALNFLAVLWVLIFRNLLFDFALHCGNNVGILILKFLHVQIDMLTSAIIIFVVMIIFVVIYYIFEE